MLHSPTLRLTPLVVLALASNLQGGCRYRPGDAWRVYGYLGRDIQDFLATGPKPVAIVEGPDGQGRTYVFEYLRVDSVVVPDPRSPAYAPRRSEPWVPAGKPGQPSIQPSILHPPVPRDVPPGRTVLRSYLLRVATDPAGIIRNFTCEEQPAMP